MIKLYLIFIMSLYTVNTYAAKIYKWVDEKGNVHYSNTAQQANPKSKIEDLSDKNKKSKNTNGNSGALSGRWYSEYRKQKYMLRFRRKTIEFREQDENGRGPWLFRGKWTRNGSAINVKYTDTQLNFAEVGKSETYKIISKSNDELVLQFPDKSVRTFYMFTPKRKSRRKSSGAFSGEWKNIKTEAVLSFIDNTFKVEERDYSKRYYNVRKYTSGQGRWEKDGRKLVFTYIGSANISNKMGTKKIFEIIYSDKVTLTLKDAVSGETFNYKRIILD